MGQYYSAVVLKPDYKNEEQPIAMAIKPHDFGNGAKMMEHAYVGNNFVAQACRFLGGKYYGYPFVWCGDYADGLITNKTTNMTVHRYKGSEKNSLGIALKKTFGDKVFDQMLGDWAEVPYNEKLFNEINDSEDFSVKAGINVYRIAVGLINQNKFPRKPTREKSVFKYILNFDTNEYVKIPRFTPKYGTYHPLPLLCSAGNGRGSGDYDVEYSMNGSNEDRIEDCIGIWAYNRIGVSNEIPNGFKELKINFGVNKYM
jgi:hypothetical protein